VKAVTDRRCRERRFNYSAWGWKMEPALGDEMEQGWVGIGPAIWLRKDRSIYSAEALSPYLTAIA
jgi:hypothetical protein